MANAVSNQDEPSPSLSLVAEGSGLPAVSRT